jgi:hypothetical protein
MERDPVWFALALDHGVLELPESRTAHSLTLELHLFREAPNGATVAWWEDDQGRILGRVTVAAA